MRDAATASGGGKKRKWKRGGREAVSVRRLPQVVHAVQQPVSTSTHARGVQAAAAVRCVWRVATYSCVARPPPTPPPPPPPAQHIPTPADHRFHFRRRWTTSGLRWAARIVASLCRTAVSQRVAFFVSTSGRISTSGCSRDASVTRNDFLAGAFRAARRFQCISVCTASVVAVSLTGSSITSLATAADVGNTEWNVRPQQISVRKQPFHFGRSKQPPSSENSDNRK